jgi:inosine-uridine nucleoside N-ribohydrolase
MTRTVLMRESDVERLRHFGGPVARAVADLADYYMDRQRKVYGVDGAPMHDSCAIVPFVQPEFIAYEDVPIEIELASPLTRGMTVVDRRPIQPGVELKSVRPKRHPNAKMAVNANVRAIIDDLVETILTYDHEFSQETQRG